MALSLGTLLLPLCLWIVWGSFQGGFPCSLLNLSTEHTLSKYRVLPVFPLLKLDLLFSRSLANSPPVSTSIALGQAQPLPDSPLCLVNPQDLCRLLLLSEFSPRSSPDLWGCLLRFSVPSSPPLYKLLELLPVFPALTISCLLIHKFCAFMHHLFTQRTLLTLKMHKGRAGLREEMCKQPL